MKHANTSSLSLDLSGLHLAPSQSWGSLRLVPLCRGTPAEDLRLSKRSYGEDLTVVQLDGRPDKAHLAYYAYVPHGLVVSWSNDGSPAVSFGTGMRDRKGKTFGWGSVRIAHRMVSREQGNRLRLLPLHLAMEGYLAHHFNGPDVAWSEYSKRAISRGLDPRVEWTEHGTSIPGFRDALRLFEIHEAQVGVLVFVADALASAFVVPHPEDYRALHRTLLEDFYAEVLLQYGLYAAPSRLETAVDASRVSCLAELREALQQVRSDWAGFQGEMVAGLFARPLMSEQVYRAGPFCLFRFMTDLRPGQENHLGEAIVRQDGTLEYLHTYRLSAAQTRRAYLLQQLAEHRWNLAATAASLKQSRNDLVRRLENAGFGYLLADPVLRAARRRRR